MRKLGHCIALVSSFATAGNVAAQDFLNDPQSAIDQSFVLASNAFEDPLIFAGLGSIVSRFNQARVETSPAGYENIAWLQGPVFETIRVVSSSRTKIEAISPLPDEELAQMLQSFSENSEAFYSFYDEIQDLDTFQDISAEQMLSYLSAYAIITNSLDSRLWETLSSFTGVWPLCFWQG